jgi:hypothetical protein
MTQPEPLQNYQPRATFSTWVGVVLLFAIFGMLAFVALKMSPRGNDYEKKRAKARAEKLDAAQKENLTALTTYAWVDKSKGIARIPIDHAMQLMLVELPGKKPTAAGPIVAASPSAAPQTSPAPSAAASPAASASASPANPSASPAAKASATPAAVPSASTTPKPTSVSGHDSEAHNQPAAAANPPSAPPNTQPGPHTSPAATAPPAPAKKQVSPAPSAAPSAPGTPLPVRGKTP